MIWKFLGNDYLTLVIVFLALVFIMALFSSDDYTSHLPPKHLM